jgi:serine/threonine protein kinase
MYVIPVRSLERNDCEEIHRTYEMKTRMGRGERASDGSVHQVCKKSTMNCDYVLKIITFDPELYELSGSKPSLLETRQNWVKEVNVLQKLNQCQSDLDIIFSPLLYDAWMCTKEDTRTHFYIVMEKYDGNLLEFISIHKKQKDMAKALVVQTLEKLDAYLMLIHSNANICMNNIKLENILYKQVGQYLYQFVFADFGISFLETNVECKSNDRKKFQYTINQFKLQVEQT